MSFKQTDGYAAVFEDGEVFGFAKSKEDAENALDADDDRAEPAVLCPRDSIIFESGELAALLVWYSKQEHYAHDFNVERDLPHLLAEFRASTAEGK